MTINKNITYIHDEIGHNLRAPNKIVPFVYNLIKPKSVIDIGCGLGTFIKVFKDIGVGTVLGIDGEWTNRDLLFKNISPEEFNSMDLTKPLILKEKFDLAISLEVAEHIDETFTNVYLDNLINASDIILFSAAIPFQGGFNHVNEQWSSYWEKKFLEKNYILCDILRTTFWGDSEIDFWYQQNICLYINKEVNVNFLKPNTNTNIMSKAVHPELYLKKATELNTILLGKKDLIFYCKLLIKYILIKIKEL